MNRKEKTTFSKASEASEAPNLTHISKTGLAVVQHQEAKAFHTQLEDKQNEGYWTILVIG